MLFNVLKITLCWVKQIVYFTFLSLPQDFKILSLKCYHSSQFHFTGLQINCKPHNKFICFRVEDVSGQVKNVE